MHVCVVRHLGDAHYQTTVTLSVLKITNGEQMMELYFYPLKMTSPRSKYISPRIADSSDDLPDPVLPTTIISFPVLTKIYYNWVKILELHLSLVINVIYSNMRG